MAEQISTLTPFRVLDANGDPISGAKAYFYETGTTNLETVYTTNALSTAHPSPLVADSEGAFPAIWHSGTPALKVVIHDASDVEINGSPLDPAPMTSSATTAANIVFTPTTNNPASDVQTAIENASSTGREVETKGAAYTVLAADRNKLIRCTTDLVLTFSASSVLGNGWESVFQAFGGNVTLTPDGSETINGTAGSLVIKKGQTVTVSCDGSNLFTRVTPVIGPIAETVISSATAAVNLDLDTSVYRSFRVEVMGVIPTAAANFLLNTSADGGSTIDNGASDYGYTNSGIVGGVATNQEATANSSIRLTTTVGTTAGRALCGEFRIFAAGDAVERTTILGSFHCRNDSGSLATIVAGGRRQTASAHDYIRLSFLGTTIAAGTFTLYGEV